METTWGAKVADSRLLVGKRIRSLRKIKDLSQEKLAEKADISSKYLGEIERGRSNLTIDIMEKLSAALEVNLVDLFDSQHESSRAILKQRIHSLIQEANDKELKIIFRILKSILR
jgi:transcriptional regulator with XRE-family HTH domain